MKEFHSLNELEKFLKKNIRLALLKDPPTAVKNLMRKHILKDVYFRYRPKEYKRRGINEGLYDKDKIIFKSKKDNTVEIYNIAKRNIRYTNQYLAPVIEFGHEGAESKGYRGYSFPYPQYAYYYPRPFIKNTREDLRKNKQHIKAFIQSLKSYGINSVHGG